MDRIDELIKQGKVKVEKGMWIPEKDLDESIYTICQNHNEFVKKSSDVKKMFDEFQYKLKNGLVTCKPIDDSNGIYFDDEEVDIEEDNDYLLDDNEDEIFNKANDYADAGDYEIAIKGYRKLLSSNRYREDALCDMGVCLQRMNNVYEALECYRLSNIPAAKENIISLYDSGKIEFNLDDYIATCDIMIKNHYEMGYVMMSWLYQDNRRGIENLKTAYEWIERGINECENHQELTLNKAFMLDKGMGTAVDYEQSHKLYEEVLNIPNAAFNYGLQCENGLGCEQDLEKAMKCYKYASDSGFSSATKALINIYSQNSKYKDEDKVNELKKLLNRQ